MLTLEELFHWNKVEKIPANLNPLLCNLSFHFLYDLQWLHSVNFNTYFGVDFFETWQALDQLIEWGAELTALHPKFKLRFRFKPGQTFDEVVICDNAQFYESMARYHLQKYPNPRSHEAIILREALRIARRQRRE